MSKWIKIPSKEIVEKTKAKLEEKGHEVFVVEGKSDALKKIKTLIPDGSEVTTGSSTTLNEIGFSEFLEDSENKLVNIQGKVWAEEDQEKRGDLRRQASSSEYFVSSINAITEDGQLIAVDATGSRIGGLVFPAKNVIIVASTNKITKNLDEAMQRIKEFVFPLENERAQQAYGGPSTFGKWLILEKEVNKGRIKIILVNEKLGF